MSVTSDVIWRWLGRGQTATDDDNDGAYRALVDSYTAPFAEVEDVVRGSDGRPGWATALDPDTAPAVGLPWLAQFAGVRYDGRLSISAMRAKIADRPYHRRGRLATIASAADRWLLYGSVDIVERDGDAWTFTVRYTDAQVGAELTYEGLAAGSATYADLADDWRHYEDVNGNEPELQASVLAETPVGLNVVFDKVAWETYGDYSEFYEETV